MENISWFSLIIFLSKLDATGHCWLAALAVYDFSIQYRPGTANVDADLLSRLLGVQVTVEPEAEVRIGDSACVISSESVAAVCKALVSHPTPVVEIVSLSDHTVQEQDFDVVGNLFIDTSKWFTVVSHGELHVH